MLLASDKKRFRMC